MPAARKQKHSQAELAALAGVSVKTIREWKKSEGLDLSDIKAVMLRAGKVERTNPTDGETYTEARRRRAIADADFAEVRAKRESGSVISVADVDALFNQIGAEMRSRLLSMRSDLVVELEGQSGPAIYRILDKRICELLESIHKTKP
jgi:phage terminase Nu1 subunit (DNA packaging protein)